MKQEQTKSNLGIHPLPKLAVAKYPNADEIVRKFTKQNEHHNVDLLLVNPPAPDGAIWIRSQHRVGRRSRENMIWPQVSLAQLAALHYPDYSVEIIDAIAMRMSWKEFEAILRDRNPRFYITHVTAPTLTNDMYGVFVAKSIGAVTIAFGTHVTPIPVETMRHFPALDYVLRGEPELSLRELIDTLATDSGRWRVGENAHLVDPSTGLPLACHDAFMWKLWTSSDPDWKPSWVGGNAQTSSQEEQLPSVRLQDQLATIKGVCWRRDGEITLNPDRPFLASLDDLPIPLHHLLPLKKYLMPMIKGPYTFIVTSRGCPAGCKFCIKHVSYQNTVRLRSPEKLLEEVWLLYELGIHHIHMYADLFTVNRDQVMQFCRLLISEGPKITWTCNSRVDFIDEEMLTLMGRAGCTLISWGIESGNEMILKKIHKGYRMEQTSIALNLAHKVGIKNWGFFIIGLPGETPATIRETIDLSKALPLDIALFHVAAPYPGTPFFYEVIENNWFRNGTNWEEVDMDQATVLDYEGLKAEELLKWQARAFKEWAFRPGPIWTMIKSMNTWEGFKSAINIGLQTLGWINK